MTGPRPVGRPRDHGCVTASEPSSPAQPAEAAATLRAVLDGLAAAPDTTADPLQLAYLRGAADALALVAGVTHGERPTVNESGRDRRDDDGDASPQVD